MQSHTVSARCVPALLAIFVLPTLAFCEDVEDWRQELASDLVAIIDGKMTMEEFSLCQIVDPTGQTQPAGPKFQVREYSEASTDAGISRDRFVTVSNLTSMAFLFGLADHLPAIKPSQILDALNCEEIDAPIGKVDLEINSYMTSEGLQFEYVDHQTGERVRATDTWQQMLGH